MRNRSSKAGNACPIIALQWTKPTTSCTPTVTSALRRPDGAAELPALLTGLSTRTGRASRIALQVDAFSNIPHQLTVGGRKVDGAWFRYIPRWERPLTGHTMAAAVARCN